MVFTGSIFTKLLIAELCLVNIFCTGFNLNRFRNMEITGRNSFTPLSITAAESIFTELAFAGSCVKDACNEIHKIR
jgi:hypothetical protein